VSFGDGGYPTEAAELLSHSTASDGSLTNYVMASAFPQNGTQMTGAAVCDLSVCTEPNVVRWGTWNNASATISGQAVSSTATNLLHYIVGSATTPANFSTLTGTATYSPIGGTTATDTSGNTYTSNFGNILMNFSNGTAALSSYSVSGASVTGAAGQFLSVPLTITQSSNAVTLSGFASNAAGNYLNVAGFFAGSSASHIGAALKVTDSNNTIKINQVQAFKK
jgi:hypothetical protein